MSAESDFLAQCILPFFQDDPLTAIYHQYAQGTYNPATSEYSTTQIDTPVKFILLDLDRTNNGLSSKFNTLIAQGDKEGYMLPTQKAGSTIPLVPNPNNDRVTVAGITYKVHVIKSADPTGSNPLLYNFLLRV